MIKHLFGIIPFDGKACHTRLLSKHIAPDTLDVGFAWRLSIELLRVIFIIDVVSDTDEFSVVVTAREEDHSDTQDLRVGDALQVRRVGFEDELVDTYWDGADEK